MRIVCKIKGHKPGRYLGYNKQSGWFRSCKECGCVLVKRSGKWVKK